MKTTMTNQFLLLIFAVSTFFSCKNPTHGEPPYQGPPKEIISIEQASEMYNAYSQRRVPIIQKYEDSISPKPSSFKPTRYIEYDLKTIKQYIAFIEHETKEANIEINTLRFYLSSYPDAEKFGDGKRVKYPKRNSFFVVPTMEHEGKNVGFYLEGVSGNYTAKPISQGAATQQGNERNKATEESKGELNEAGFLISSNSAVLGGGTSLILNDGGLAPPPGSDDFGNN